MNFASSDEVDQAVAAAAEAFKSWKETPVSERARLMMRYAALLKEHHDDLAEILARDTGKVLKTRKATSGAASK